MRCLSQCCRTSAQSPELGYKIPRDLGTCRASVEAGASTSYKIPATPPMSTAKAASQRRGVENAVILKNWILNTSVQPEPPGILRSWNLPSDPKMMSRKRNDGHPLNELCKTQTNRKVHCRIKMISENEKTSSWMRSCVHDLLDCQILAASW